MKSLFIIATATALLFAQNNATKKSDINNTISKNIQKEIEKEKKYAKEQKFYMGKDYNLSEHQVDKNTLKNVPVIKPDYDFDMSDVYRDDDENVSE